MTANSEALARIDAALVAHRAGNREDFDPALLEMARAELVRLSTPEPPTDDEREALDAVMGGVRWADGQPVVGSRVGGMLADAILASPVWRNRHRGPITDEEALRLGKVAWVAHQGDTEWANSVVEDCFSPADDLPKDALDMIAVARAVIEAAEAARTNHTDGD